MGEEISGDMSIVDLVALGNVAQFMAYGKHHLLVEEGKPIDKIFVIKSGWVRRVRGIPVYQDITEGTGQSAFVPEDFLCARNCLGLQRLTGQTTWAYSAALMARSVLLWISLAELRRDQHLSKTVLA